MKYIIKLDRIAAWTLLFTIFTFFLSGYGMPKGIISPQFSALLHKNILPTIGIIAFSIHTSFAVHLSLRRWNLWNTATKILLFIAYGSMLLGFIYVTTFFKKPVIQKSVAVIEKPKVMNTTKTFTNQELATFNGKNGTPAYIAVDGIVYDVSTVFKSGNHKGYSAGQDLTTEFHAQHTESILKGFTIMGTLAQ